MSSAVSRQKDASYQVASPAKSPAPVPDKGDSQASTAMAPAQSIADKVTAQLGGDYPASALKWVSTVSAPPR